MSRLVFTALLSACALLAGCDGEPVDYSGERYDIVLTWVNGNAELDVAGVYGTPGVAAATNQPGARRGAASWKDSAGNFWLFGGQRYETGTDPVKRLHDLWMYNPSSGQWTWMGGSDEPGGTLSHSGAGVYGTLGVGAPANLPGARVNAVSWRDANGDFWLFGGEGHDSAGNLGRLNDLWMYDISANEWVWVSGSTLVNQSGVYGTQGTADAANLPGGRHSATGWIDGSGTLWLLGGSGFDQSGACCFLNDLWTFSGGNWTWVGGSALKDPAPVYGAQNTAAAANAPSGRVGAMTWLQTKTVTDPATLATTTTETVWLYGGQANTAGGGNIVSAELWKYVPGTGWAWVTGTQSSYRSGTWESRGAMSLTAQPGSRSNAVTWTGSDGSLWLFGGNVESAGGVVSNPNDIWRWRDVAWQWEGGKSYDSLGANYRGLGQTGQPGGRSHAVGWLGNDGKLWLFGGQGDDFDRNDLWFYEPPATAP